jgi:hypothetical protein
VTMRRASLRDRPARRQFRLSAQDETLAPVGVVGIVDGKIRRSAQQGCDRDLGLVPGQLGAEAEMDAPEERQRADVLSGDVEAIGLGVDLGIPVRGAKQAQDCFAFPDCGAADLDVLKRGTAALRLVANLHSSGASRRWASYRPVLAKDEPERGLAGDAAHRGVGRTMPDASGQRRPGASVPLSRNDKIEQM